ncbi:MAG: CAP domain-containing protein [Deinococcus sp.]|nr:CAP domain-containing protein [Deinococcus sp.]
MLTSPAVRPGLPTLLLLSVLLSACGGTPAPAAPAHTDPAPPQAPLSSYVWYPGADRAASAEELEVLRLTNQIRAQGAACGASATQPATTYPAAPALAWNDRLAHAARNHAQDMAVRNYFGHVTPEGVRAADRVTLAGYTWRTAGENIAVGYPDPAAVVDGWLKSPGHCHNLMKADYRDLGVGFFRDSDPSDKYSTYWGQSFGAQ